MDRKPISNKLRFEILKRDSFTCQYCGRKAPDVELEIDHIVPVARGGCNDIDNLITACHECNMGKRDRCLEDPAEFQTVNAEKIRAEASPVIRSAIENARRSAEAFSTLADLISEYVFAASGIILDDREKASVIIALRQEKFEKVFKRFTLVFEPYDGDWDSAFGYAVKGNKLFKEVLHGSDVD